MSTKLRLSVACGDYEIIRALKRARNELVDLEKLSDEDLDKLEKQFERLRLKAEHDGHHCHEIPAADSSSA